MYPMWPFIDLIIIIGFFSQMFFSHYFSVKWYDREKLTLNKLWIAYGLRSSLTWANFNRQEEINLKLAFRRKSDWNVPKSNNSWRWFSQWQLLCLIHNPFVLILVVADFHVLDISLLVKNFYHSWIEFESAQ